MSQGMPLAHSVAKTFSQAASHYKNHDVLQRLTAAALLEKAHFIGRLLDVGAGPGTCFSQFNRVTDVIALDIAQGMLDTLRVRFPDYQTICSDVQSLSLESQSVDSVYSNLALQWCDDLPLAIQELHRVLVTGGECHLSIVADGSMPELQALGFSTNEFSPLAEMLAAFEQTQHSAAPQGQHSPWELLEAKVEKVVVYFDSLRSLLYSIKGVGASVPNVSLGPKKPLLKSDWQHRLQLAEGLRTEQGIPLTYQIAYIRAKTAK